MSVAPPPTQPLLPPRPEQGRALLTVLIIMACLAALALLFARGADRLSERWTAQLSQTSTVQLLSLSDADRDAQTGTATTLLRQAVPDARVAVLTREEAGALIEPWLGDGALPPDLPVPTVIQVDSPTRLPVETLERQFAEAGLTTVIDDHSRFSEQLKRTVGRLVLLGAGLVGLVGVAATAVSLFATRAGLASQRDIIHVLVQSGATDGFVARLFVEQAARRGAVGGSVGAGAAFLTWIFVSFGPAQGSVGWRGIGDAFGDAVMLIALCAAFATVCAAAAGWAATRQLAAERRRA